MTERTMLTDDKGYAHPDSLVSTDWLAEHLGDPDVRILGGEDLLLYGMGHVPGAQKIDWHEDLNDPLNRDYLSREGFQALLDGTFKSAAELRAMYEGDAGLPAQSDVVAYCRRLPVER